MPCESKTEEVFRWSSVCYLALFYICMNWSRSYLASASPRIPVVLFSVGSSKCYAIVLQQLHTSRTTFYPCSLINQSYRTVIKYVVNMSSCFMIITLSLCSSSPVVNAALRFYNSSTVISGRKDQPAVKKQITKTLNVTTNPEEKRKIIGDTFIKVRTCCFLPNVWV